MHVYVPEIGTGLVCFSGSFEPFVEKMLVNWTSESVQVDVVNKIGQFRQSF